MVTTVEVQGQCDSRFSAVEDAFRDNFATRDEVGASVAVYAGGKLVVDLWGGYADAARSRPWERDTIVNVYSTTKGMTAICAHCLADQGKLDFDAPVAKYWPEFAQAGKGDIPVRYLLSHRAGLPAVSAPLPPEAMFDWAPDDQRVGGARAVVGAWDQARLPRPLPTDGWWERWSSGSPARAWAPTSGRKLPVPWAWTFT